MTTAMISLPAPSKPRRFGLFTAVWAVSAVVLSLALRTLQAATNVISPDVLSLVMIAPALAAGLALVLVRGSGWPAVSGSRVLPGRRYAGLLLAACGFSVVCYLASALFAGTLGVLPAVVGGLPLVLMLGLQLVGAIAEEIGYRGVLLSYFLQRMPRRVAVVLNGLAFGLIHIQYWAEGPATVAWFLVATIALVWAISLLWHGSTTQRVVTAGVMHFGVNISLFVVAGAGTFAMPMFTGGVVVAALVLFAGIWLGRQLRYPAAAARG